MKTGTLKNETDIKASIMSLFDEMIRLKDDIQMCKKAIIDHANEARHSNDLMNDTVAEMKFSVTNLQANMLLVQQSLKNLTELAASLVTIGRFIVILAKAATFIGGITLTIMGIIKFIG